jgi:nucleoside phosphorylase
VRIDNRGGTIGAVGPGSTGTVNVGAPAARSEESAGATVGIVSALPAEHVPMERLLLRASAPRWVPDDRAAYRLGELPSTDPARPHRVVLTLTGETGNNAAATACTNLNRSFPSVTCVLMVGIAAGIPRRGVRPGDVLVSTEGVVDYDHVRERPRGVELRRTFPLPSNLLVRASRELEMAAIGGRETWTRWLQTDLEGYARPGPGGPQVHGGQIGSADRSLRSAAVRDELAKRHPRLVGFEMEGAGIGSSAFLAGVEYLVVRGVSDLAEAGRDSTWRRYAALVAAAYTRGLLEFCPPVSARGGRVG